LQANGIEPPVSIQVEKTTSTSRVQFDGFIRAKWPTVGVRIPDVLSVDNQIQDAIAVQIHGPTRLPASHSHCVGGSEDRHTAVVSPSAVQKELRFADSAMDINNIEESVAIEVREIGRHVGMAEMPQTSRIARVGVPEPLKVAEMQFVIRADSRITHDPVPRFSGSIGIVPTTRKIQSPAPGQVD
jgi:hypothetical protein